MHNGFRRLAGIGMGLAAVVLGPGNAHADTVVPPPDGHQTVTTAIGVPVDLSRTGTRGDRPIPGAERPVAYHDRLGHRVRHHARRHLGHPGDRIPRRLPARPHTGKIGIQYADRGIQVSGCAGYAQARAYSLLSVTNDRGTAEVTLYGRPFSIG